MAFLAHVHERQIPLCSPSLLCVEVAAGVARALGDAELALALATALRALPNQTLVALDDPLAERAASLAARARLRGAGAVYAAVAHACVITLVTLDRQQLDRVPPWVRVARPAELLGGAAAD
jgi:predicted nucleic acid-binding protein